MAQKHFLMQTSFSVAVNPRVFVFIVCICFFILTVDASAIPLSASVSFFPYSRCVCLSGCLRFHFAPRHNIFLYRSQQFCICLRLSISVCLGIRLYVYLYNYLLVSKLICVHFKPFVRHKFLHHILSSHNYYPLCSYSNQSICHLPVRLSSCLKACLSKFSGSWFPFRLAFHFPSLPSKNIGSA